jgi:hypothetical protein
MRIYHDFYGWGTVYSREKGFMLVIFDDEPDTLTMIHSYDDDEDEYDD